MVEFAGNGRRVANTIPRPLHRIAHGLRMPPSDGGNFIEGKPLNAVQEKRLAVGAIGSAERGLHKCNQFVGVSGLFRSGNALIWNRTFARPTLVGLMKLQ